MTTPSPRTYYGDPKPGPNAPAYVNWRIGQLVTP